MSKYDSNTKDKKNIRVVTTLEYYLDDWYTMLNSETRFKFYEVNFHISI